MKTFIFLSSCIFALLLSQPVFSDTITLNKALESNMIAVAITGADQSGNSGSYTPSYTGLCIQLEIENLTGNNIKVFLDAGRFLQPEDTSVQRMMVTKDQMITLIKKSKKKTRAYAMCSQLLRHAPGTSTKFSLGKKADGKLLELAQLLSKNNYQSGAAQSAVWALTDNDDVYNITSDNPAETKALRTFIKAAKGIKDEPAVNKNSAFNLKQDASGTFMKYNKGKVNGSFEFELKADTPLSLTLFNDKGDVARKCMQDYTFHEGTNTVTYEFSYFNTPAGNYHLKLIDGSGAILIDKIITFK